MKANDVDAAIRECRERISRIQTLLEYEDIDERLGEIEEELWDVQDEISALQDRATELENERERLEEMKETPGEEATERDLMEYCRHLHNLER